MLNHNFHRQFASGYQLFIYSSSTHTRVPDVFAFGVVKMIQDSKYGKAQGPNGL